MVPDTADDAALAQFRILHDRARVPGGHRQDGLEHAVAPPLDIRAGQSVAIAREPRDHRIRQQLSQGDRRDRKAGRRRVLGQ